MNKKILWTSFVLLAALTASGFTEDKMSTNDRLTKLENEMKEISTTNREGVTIATFGVEKDSDQNWFAEADVLLWHAKGGGLDWVLVYNQANLPHEGRMKYLDFGWDWGVRVGAGYHFTRDHWDLSGTYTYFQTNDSQHVHDDFATYDSASEATATGRTNGGFSGKVTLNEVDITLGKEYFVSQYLSVRPSASLEAVWLDQRYKLNTSSYINASETSLNVEGTLDTHVKDRTNVFGIGPRLGVDANWFFYNHFKMIGAASLALLQGYFKVSQYQDLSTNPVESSSTYDDIKLRASMHRLFPHARMLLGLAWSDTLKNGKHRLEVSGAYEVNYFFRANQDVNQLSSNPSVPPVGAEGTPFRMFIERLSEDMAFYGVTFRAKIDF